MSGLCGVRVCVCVCLHGSCVVVVPMSRTDGSRGVWDG